MATETAASQRAIQDECIRLIESDTARARSELYLRLLYGKQWSDFVQTLLRDGDVAIPSVTRAVLDTIDWQLLALEQEARRRNLTKHIMRAFPSLDAVLSPTLLAELVEDFVNAPQFWIARGRTLHENFCLFAHERLDDGHSFERDVLRLCGVVTGLTVAPETPSPWPEQPDEEDPPTVDGAEAIETFITEWRLIDRTGALPGADNVEEVRQPGRHRIVVATFPGRQVFAVSLPIEGRP